MIFAEQYKVYTDADFKLSRGGGKRFSSPLLKVRREWARKNIRKAVSGQIVPPDLRRAGHPDYIVSLTSFPARLAGLPMMLRSVFMQDMLPGGIVLWLCEGEWPERERELPALEEFRRKGLRVEFVNEDFKPHLKYYHTFHRYPDKHIVTLDDDLIYQPDTVSRLAELSATYPGTVCANRTRRITAGPYSLWPNRIGKGPECGHGLIALGYGGVLYPPGDYRHAFLDSGLFMKLAPRADDLWLKAVELSEGIQVAGGDVFIHPVTVPGSQRISLASTNLAGTGNDKQWDRLDRHFGLTEKLFR